jgi:hypothetical protein
VSTNASSGNEACLWRSYPTESSEDTPSRCTTIALAACLTAAAPLYFPEVRLPGSTKASEEVHIDGGFGYNNPTDILIREARSLWPGVTIHSVVSLGTGAHKHKAPKKRKLQPWTYAKDVLKRAIDVASDARRVHDDLDKTLRKEKIHYLRLNVPDLAHHVDLSDWQNLELIKKETWQYLKRTGSSLICQEIDRYQGVWNAGEGKAEH